MFKYAFPLFLLCMTSTVTACSSDSDGEKKSGDSNNKGTNDDDGKKPDDGKTDDGKTDDTSGCTGDITNCTLGSLSSKQHDDMCALIAKTLDDTPGTKYECEEGPHEGLYLEVQSKETCMATPLAKATCEVTVGQTIDCYKAARKDTCEALSESGACSFLFDTSSGCLS